MYVYTGLLPLLLELIYAIKGLAMFDSFNNSKVIFSLCLKLIRLVHLFRSQLSLVSISQTGVFSLDLQAKLPSFVTLELIEQMTVASAVPQEIMINHEKDLEPASLAICELIVESFRMYYKGTDYWYIYNSKTDIDKEQYSEG